MHSLSKLGLAGTLAWTASAVLAAPPAIVTQGKGAAIACAICHGEEGGGNAQAGYPALARLPAAYIAKQLADFKAGTRRNAVMSPIAAALQAEDVDAAARYFADLPRPKPAAVAADAALVARGKDLANSGDWGRQVPPCFKCHATDGTGVPPHFPPIAGQNAPYTEAQLKAWQAGTRANDPQKLMRTVARHLTADDVRAVAAYLATLGPQEGTK